MARVRERCGYECNIAGLKEDGTEIKTRKKKQNIPAKK